MKSMRGHNSAPITLPTTTDLTNLPLAEGGTYLLTPAQVATLRARIYSLNHNNVRGWRWRTMQVHRSGKGKNERIMLLVWRVV